MNRQLEMILGCTAKVNLASGAVRTGKTYGMVFSWMVNLARYPIGSVHGLVAWNTSKVRSILLDDNIRMHTGSDLISRKDHLVLWGRRLEMLGASDERARMRAKGFTFHSILADEVATFPETFFHDLQSRMSPAGSRMFATTNPEGPSHWLKRLIDNADGDRLKVFNLTLDDNPHIPEREKEYLRRSKQEAGQHIYERDILGLWVEPYDAIFRMDKAMATVGEIPDLLRFKVGVDYATSSPSAAVLLGEDADGRVWVVDEWYSHNDRETVDESIEKQADRLSWWLKDIGYSGVVYVDPAANHFASALKERGHRTPVRGKKSGELNSDRSVTKGVLDLNEMLGKGNFRVVRERCPELWREMSGLSWDNRQKKLGVDKPVKGLDHAVDATRYSLRGQRWGACEKYERSEGASS